MAQPFKVIDGDRPEVSLGEWTEQGNIILPGSIILGPDGAVTIQTTGEAFQVIGSGPFVPVFVTQVDGDVAARFIILANGTLGWGDGTGATDVNLYRYAANGLATDDAFKLAAAAILLLGVAGDVNLYRSAAGNLATDNSFVIAQLGAGIQVKGGVNATAGTGVLVAGTCVVNTNKVTAASRIFVTQQVPGGVAGALGISARVAGTSFTVTSTSGADTGTFAWWICEPAP